MIAHILYQKNAPGERDILYFQRRLKEFQVESKLIETESRDGISQAGLYDLTSWPAVVLLRIDGSPVERWQGGLPLAEDVSYLAHQ